MTDPIWKGYRLRQGKKVGRTLYLTSPAAPGGILVGMIDTLDVAEEIVRRWNEAEDEIE